MVVCACCRWRDFILLLSVVGAAGGGENERTLENLRTLKLELTNDAPKATTDPSSSFDGDRIVQVLLREGDAGKAAQLARRICAEYDVNHDACTRLRAFLLAQTGDAEMRFAEQKMALTHDGNGGNGCEVEPGGVERGRDALLRVIALLEGERAALASELAEQSEAFLELLRIHRRDFARARRQLAREGDRWHNQHRERKQQLEDVYFGTDWDDFGTGEELEKTAPVCWPIARRRTSELTYQEYLSFAARSEPVVITDWLEVAERHGQKPWTLERIAALCGDERAVLKRADGGGEGWAGLQAVSRARVADFIKLAANRTSSPLYLHDMSLLAQCEALLGDFIVPRHFSRDWLQRVPSEFHQDYRGLRDYWPSLFIGGSSTNSALHKDYLDTAAWMGLFQGHKRWAIVPPHEQPLLHPDLSRRDEISALRFQADLLNDTVDEGLYFGGARYVSHFETLLAPGEAIFIPSGSAHQVANLDLTVSVAMNFVDGGGAARFISRLRERRFATDDWTTRNYFSSLHDEFGAMLERLRAEGGVEEEARLAMPMSVAQFKHGTGFDDGARLV